MKDVQYHVDVMKNMGDILSTAGVFSTMEAILSAWKDMLSTVGECSVP